MNLFIKSAKIIDPAAAFNGKKADIFIENGIIKSIAEKMEQPQDVQLFEAENLHVSPGWFDMHTNLNDPGFEFKEDILTGSAAAAAGGFTEIACMPSTLPPIHTKAQVEYIKNKSKKLIVEVYPVGALSYNLEGKEIAEMYDMFLSGAVAFSDNKKSVSSSSLLLRALLYTKGFDALIMSFAEDRDLVKDGKMNESETSTLLGLKGIPALAEELNVSRDLLIAEYANCKIHFSSISSSGAVNLIREAKAKGMAVTADVSAHQLFLDDTYLKDFDSNYKVKPPLRNTSDIIALKEGLADGTIDVVCSDHTPQDVESKVKEFDYADFGIIALETAFATANTALKEKINLTELVNKIAIRPRQILNLPVPIIKEGAAANLTLFDPEKKWKFTENDIRSKSKNTPFIGTTFTGKALGIFNKNQWVLC